MTNSVPSTLKSELSAISAALYEVAHETLTLDGESDNLEPKSQTAQLEACRSQLRGAPLR